MAEGGGRGEEFRHARAKDRGRPHRPAHQSRATQKSFLFLLEEKIGRAQIGKSEENFFVGRAGFRHGGGAASLGVLLKVGSSKVQNFPQIFLILIPVSGESCYTRAHDGTGAQGINESSGSETAGDTAT